MKPRILKVDLSRRSHRVETLPREIIQQYIGGRGLGAYLLYRSVPAAADPLGEHNHLIFTAGPANGTGLFFSSKAVVTTKSPLTGIYLYSVASGTFTGQLRQAGYWALDISGIADSPVYLEIDNQKVTIKDAAHLWGLETARAQQLMMADRSPRQAATVAIGPAGENLLSYAAIMSEGSLYRSMARGGSGCVMGAKKLKGILVHGDGEVDAGDLDLLQQVRQALIEKRRSKARFAQRWRQYGSAGSVREMNDQAMLPTRNWQSGQFSGWEKICTETNAEQWPRHNRSCGPHCIAPCSHDIEIDHGPYRGARCDGPEWETIYSFGTCCGVDKFDAIVAANQRCDESGLDTMSAGISIAFAMECFETGLISTQDTHGIELRFGDDRAMLAMLDKIINQEGLGQLLSQGVRRASAQIPGSAGFAMHAKGLELGGYECRDLRGQALQFAISNVGGSHHAYGLTAWMEGFNGTNMQIAGKGALVQQEAIRRIIRDSIPVCTFVFWIVDFELCRDIVSALLSRHYEIDDLNTVGMRVMCLERLFNMREGFSRDDDTLPPRLLTEPKPDGPNRGATVPLEELKDDFYRTMKWDVSTGNPPDSLLSEVEIEK